MTSLSFESLKFSVDHFTDIKFVSDYNDTIGRFDEHKFENYVGATVNLDYLKIRYRLKNKIQVENTISEAKELLQHIDRLALQCRGFEREHHKEYQEFVAFVNENLKLNRKGFKYTGDYIYSCLTLLHAFSRKSTALKTDIDNLLAQYENILVESVEPAPINNNSNTKSIVWPYTTTFFDEQQHIKYQAFHTDQSAMLEEHIDKKKPTVTTANSNTPAVTEEPMPGKEHKLTIPSLDNIMAYLCALKETKWIVTDDETEPTSKQLAELIYTNFKVKKKKGEGFYPFDTIERYFGINNDEASKNSKFEKLKKEFLKALQSGK